MLQIILITRRPQVLVHSLFYEIITLLLSGGKKFKGRDLRKKGFQ